MSCATRTKPEPEETETSLNDIYFPVPPLIEIDGEEIPKCYEDIEIQGEYYDKAVVTPYWWWTVLMMYINENEAAVQKVLALMH